VFSADERRMYRQLREALPHHIILAKLPLVRFCQPTDPQQVRYWYNLLGAAHIGFAICSVNGRVLAAIDLNYERSGPPSRTTRIKQSVLGACRVRYLRCAPDHLPSVPELQLLVPHTANASRGPQPATAGQVPTVSTPAGRGLAFPQGMPAQRRRERTPLWNETMDFKDSFFSAGGRFSVSEMGDLLPLDETSTGPNGHRHHADSGHTEGVRRSRRQPAPSPVHH
jgi:hypothetical protein